MLLRPAGGHADDGPPGRRRARSRPSAPTIAAPTPAPPVLLGRPAPADATRDVRAITDCRFFALPASRSPTVFREWYPMAVHLLEGLFIGQRNIARSSAQRERLLALGSLTAGLTHELNNPAAAAIPGDGRAARPVRRDAAEARDARRGKLDGEMLRVADRAAGGVRGRVGGARDALRRWSGPTARTQLADWLERPRHRRAAGSSRRRLRRRPGSDVDASTGSPTPSRRVPGVGAALARPTPSSPRPCWSRSPTAPAGSPRWSTPPSSTRRWTGRRTSRPTCTPASTPRW